MGVACKCGGHIVAAGDVAEHDVVHVGIDAAATALAAVVLNAVLLAVGHVNLAVDELVAAKNHCGFHAPGEEQLVNAVVILYFLRGVLLHRKIEREPPHILVGQFKVFHFF